MKPLRAGQLPGQSSPASKANHFDELSQPRVAGWQSSRRRFLAGVVGAIGATAGSTLSQATQAPPRPTVPVTTEEVVRGDPNRPWISLVINAGAGSRVATSIVDTFEERGVKTSFFLLGYWAEPNAELVRRLAERGHEIANHGHRIFDLTKVADAEVTNDLETADRVISGVTGQTTKPLWSPSAGYRDARVRRLAASIGFRCIFWTLDSGDWRPDATAEAVTQRVLTQTENGSIVVMHLDSPRSADTVAPALPAIIDGLTGRGFRLVTITELVTGQLFEPSE